ncbi:MAG TPA: AI-2E family transporter [Novosphingobium sp.]|nr:AI-2E family transporter [Novosphingobium sp.]
MTEPLDIAASESDAPVEGVPATRLLSSLVLLLGVALFLALPFVLSVGSVVFLPLVAAIILTIVLSPLADRLIRLGVPNVVASAISLVTMIGAVVFALFAIIQPAYDLVDQAPELIARIGEQFSTLRGNFTWVSDINRQLARIFGQTTGSQVVVASPSVLEQVAFATPTVVLETLLTLLMTYFMIEARIRMKRRLLLERHSFGASLRAARVMRDVQDRVASYILTVAQINLGVGVIVALGAWALGLTAPIMWGGLAMVLNFLPYLGPLTMMALLGLVGLGTADSVLLGLVPMLLFLALHSIEANAITPTVLGARFTINPVMILLSISYFSWVWGVVGALLSVPILLTLTALIEHLGKPNVVGFLFGEPLFDGRESTDEVDEPVLIDAPQPSS